MKIPSLFLVFSFVVVLCAFASPSFARSSAHAPGRSAISDCVTKTQSLNHLKSPHLIYVGQTIKMACGAQPEIRVKQGDALSVMAQSTLRAAMLANTNANRALAEKLLEKPRVVPSSAQAPIVPVSGDSRVAANREHNSHSAPGVVQSVQSSQAMSVDDQIALLPASLDRQMTDLTDTLVRLRALEGSPDAEGMLNQAQRATLWKELNNRNIPVRQTDLFLLLLGANDINYFLSDQKECVSDICHQTP